MSDGRVITTWRVAVHRLVPQPLVGAATLVLALLALGAAWFGLLGGPPPAVSGVLVALALGLTGATVAAYRFPVHLSRHRKMQMATVPYYLLAVLVAPPLAALAAGVGALGGEMLVRRQRGSTASDMASAVGRRVLIVLLGSSVAHVPLPVGLSPLMLLATAASMGATDVLTFPLVVAPMSGERPRHVIATTVQPALRFEGAQYLVGLLGALAAAHQLWAVVLLVVPSVLVYLAFQAMARAEAAQCTAEAAQLETLRALRVRDTFLASASHDLRTPLTSLLGRAQILQGLLDAGHPITPVILRQHVASQLHMAQRMVATVEEITDAAHLEIGHPLILRCEPVDVGVVVQGVVQTTAEPARVSVQGEIAPSMVIQGDRARLERVVQNVLDNALKYSAPTSPVQVEVHEQDCGVVITVRDRGVGIPAEELPLIFTPYYRASTAQSTAGSGLGLAGTKAVIEQLGGSIALESTLGQGTTVLIRLPCGACAEGEDHLGPREELRGAPTISNSSPC